MKKVAIVFAVFIVLLVVVGLVASRNLNSYLENNRPWIEEQLEVALGRGVEIGGLGASLGWGVSAQIRDLAVADDPAFSKESFLTAGEAVARVNLLPLLSGRVEVGRIEIRKPEIRVIQTAKGMNLDSLGGRADASAASEDEVETGTGAANATAVAIALFRITDATLLYIDTTAKPRSEIEVGGLDVDFRSDGELEAFQGRLELDAARVRLRSGDREDAQWEPVRVRADLAREGELLQIRNAELQAAELKLLADATVSGLAGSPSVETTFSSPGGELAGIPFAGLDGALRYAGERATVERLVIKIFGGDVSARGVYNMRDPGRPSFTFDTVIDGVRIEQAVASQSERASGFLEGEVQSELNLVGSGASWEAMKPSLSGSGEFHLIEGVLHNVNLGETAFGALGSVPGLANLLDAEMRGRYPALFGGEDTRFERADTAVKIGGGVIQVVDLALAARDFSVVGAGRLSLDGALDLPTRLVCSDSLSADLVERQSALRALRGPSDRVEFPVRLSGNLPDLRVTPDVAAVAKALGTDRARDLLSKALGGKGAEGAPEPEGAAEGDDSSKKLLRKGLDSLLGR